LFNKPFKEIVQPIVCTQTDRPDHELHSRSDILFPASQCDCKLGILKVRKEFNKMEVFEAVRTVLAVRAYQDKPVPPEAVHRIVEAARLTASSMNGQPWHFIVVENPDTLKKLGALARSGPYIAQAPLAIVVAMEKSIYAVSDASRAIQSMVLTAWSEGIGSNWVGFGNLSAIKPVLDIPEAIDVMAIVPFGYPSNGIGKGKKKRKPLSEIAHQERFGQAFK
jgi:nitroreductase